MLNYLYTYVCTCKNCDLWVIGHFQVFIWNVILKQNSANNGWLLATQELFHHTHYMHNVRFLVQDSTHFQVDNFASYKLRHGHVAIYKSVV